MVPGGEAMRNVPSPAALLSMAQGDPGRYANFHVASVGKKRRWVRISSTQVVAAPACRNWVFGLCLAAIARQAVYPRPRGADLTPASEKPKQRTARKAGAEGGKRHDTRCRFAGAANQMPVAHEAVSLC